MAAKVVFSRLPAGYSFWQRRGLFKHGPMEDPEYAYLVFTKHFDRVQFARKNSGFVGMELGPGDTLGSALVAACFGATRFYLIDVGSFARADIGPYIQLYEHLRLKGLRPPDVSAAKTREDVLEACNASYLTDGIRSLQTLADASVDFVFSNAVYEHIRRAEVLPMTRELRRVLRRDGATSHSIDLKDHLGGGLANLRFSDETWESDFMTKSGFYTNRLRAQDFLRIFEEAGLPPRVLRASRWPRLPISRSSVAPMFHGYTDEQLLVSDVDLVADGGP